MVGKANLRKSICLHPGRTEEELVLLICTHVQDEVAHVFEPGYSGLRRGLWKKVASITGSWLDKRLLGHFKQKQELYPGDPWLVRLSHVHLESSNKHVNLFKMDDFGPNDIVRWDRSEQNLTTGLLQKT